MSLRIVASLENCSVRLATRSSSSRFFPPLGEAAVVVLFDLPHPGEKPIAFLPQLIDEADHTAILGLPRGEPGLPFAELGLQLGEGDRPALDLVEMRLGPFDESREFLDAGVDVNRAVRFRRLAEHVKRPVEAIEQRRHVVTQRRQLGELRIEQRNAIAQRFLFAGKLLHSPGERTSRRLLQRSDFPGELIASRIQLLDPFDDAVAGGGERSEPCLQGAVILLQSGKRLRRALDIIAAFVALPDEIHHLLQVDIERDGIIRR